MQDDIKEKTGRMSVNRRTLPVWVLIFLSVFFTSGTVQAHKVYIFAWVEGDRVYTDSYFPDKKKVINGSVTVFDAAGNRLVQGKTDEQGAFSFPVPKKTDLRIVLQASMGHKGEFLLKAEELSGGVPGTTTEPETKETSAADPRKDDIDWKDVERVIEKALEAKLRPIERKLARLEEEKGPGFTEVVGGIGYIVGLMGIVAYFKSRRAD
jgi:nickel transport protein